MYESIPTLCVWMLAPDKLRRSFFPHQAPKLKLSLITSTWLHLIITKIFIILHHPYFCYIYTLFNLFAHSSCTFLLILLFIKSTVYYSAHYFIAHFIFIFFFSIFFLLFIFYFSFYLCIFSCACVTYNCTFHEAYLTYISQLIIFCIIRVKNCVCDKKNLEVSR